VQVSKVIASEAEFEAVMSDIDSELQRNGIKIHGRELAAAMSMGKRLGTSLRLGPNTPPPIPGNYTGESLVAHVYAWIQARYGDRLRIDLTHFYSVTRLGGDVWIVRVPEVLGGPIRFFAEVDLAKQHRTFVAHRPGSPVLPLEVNVLRLVEHMTAASALICSSLDKRTLVNYIFRAHRAMALMKLHRRDEPLRYAICSDLTVSARSALEGSNAHGQSRWASLQAAEKALKLFLKEKSIPHPRTHDIENLIARAKQAGLRVSDPQTAAKVQCSASVRYEGDTGGIDAAVTSHQSAVELMHDIASALWLRPNATTS
jgi:hypothetical protein